MRLFNLNISRSLKEFLGRLYGHLSLYTVFYSCLYPLQTLWDRYDERRRRMILLSNITGQVISLEFFLNHEYDPTQQRIQVLSNSTNVFGVPIALEVEESPALELGIDGLHAGVPIASTTDKNFFIVRVPVALVGQSDQIKATVNRFKLAGKNYVLRYY